MASLARNPQGSHLGPLFDRGAGLVRVGIACELPQSTTFCLPSACRLRLSREELAAGTTSTAIALKSTVTPRDGECTLINAYKDWIYGISVAPRRRAPGSPPSKPRSRGYRVHQCCCS